MSDSDDIRVALRDAADAFAPTGDVPARARTSVARRQRRDAVASTAAIVMAVIAVAVVVPRFVARPTVGLSTAASGAATTQVTNGSAVVEVPRAWTQSAPGECAAGGLALVVGAGYRDDCTATADEAPGAVVYRLSSGLDVGEALRAGRLVEVGGHPAVAQRLAGEEVLYVVPALDLAVRLKPVGHPEVTAIVDSVTGTAAVRDATRTAECYESPTAAEPATRVTLTSGEAPALACGLAWRRGDVGPTPAAPRAWTVCTPPSLPDRYAALPAGSPTDCAALGMEAVDFGTYTGPFDTPPDPASGHEEEQ